MQTLRKTMPEGADLVRSLERVLRISDITRRDSNDATRRAHLRSALAGEAAHLAVFHQLGEAEILQNKTLGEVAYLPVALTPGRPGQQVFDHTARLREHAGNLLDILKREKRGSEAGRPTPCHAGTLHPANRRP
jgi:hypothetical protein